MTRFYWLLSDGKTVREISREEYMSKATTKKRVHRLAWCDDKDLCLVHRANVTFISHRQLRQVLGDA